MESYGWFREMDSKHPVPLTAGEWGNYRAVDLKAGKKQQPHRATKLSAKGTPRSKAEWAQRAIRRTQSVYFTHPSKDLTILLQSPADYWKDREEGLFLPTCQQPDTVPEHSVVSPKHSGWYEELQDQTQLKHFWKPNQDGIFSRLPSSAAWFNPLQVTLPLLASPCVWAWCLLWVIFQLGLQDPATHNSLQFICCFSLDLAQSWQRRKPWRAEQPHRQ